jgi:hypothetical protein
MGYNAMTITSTQEKPTEQRTAMQVVLDDYKTLRTGGPSNSEQDVAISPRLHGDRIDPSLASHPKVPNTVAPSTWPGNYRRIPAYRPVNYALDKAERPTGDDPVISVFLITVFCGCALMSVCHVQFASMSP